MSTTPQIAQIADYKSQLFDLYKRFRYNELISDHLRHDAMRIEKFVRWSVLIAVAISLMTGGEVAFARRPELAPVWAVFAALSTLLSVYSLIVSSGSKQFSWFSLSMKFRAVADDIEFFSELVKLGKITETELMTDWKRFTDRLAALLEQANVELKEFDMPMGPHLTKSLWPCCTRRTRVARL